MENKMPEKAWIRTNSPKIGNLIEGENLSYSCYNKPKSKKDMEYIRWDLASEFAFEFGLFCTEHCNKNKSITELFNEFKKVKE